MSSMRFARRGTLARVVPLVFTLIAPARLVAQGVAIVTGHVTGENSGPLPAVTVSVAGMALGSSTGPDGVYSFTVPANRVTGQVVQLTARRVGYAPQNAQITLGPG